MLSYTRSLFSRGVSVLSANERKSDLSLSGYAPGLTTEGSRRYWPVNGVCWNKGSSRALRAMAAARFAPAESPPTRKPFLRSSRRSSVARCAAIEMTPLLVEAKLGRHAALYKVGDCECCPLPRWSEYLARAEQERKEQERVYRGRLSRSGRVSLKDETKEEKVVKARVKERHAPKVQSTLSGDSEEDEVALMLDGRLDIIIAC